MSLFTSFTAVIVVFGPHKMKQMKTLLVWLFMNKDLH